MPVGRRHGDSRVAGVSAAEFESAVSSPGVVLVECWAPWCGACRTFDPIFEQAAARHAQHAFARLDTHTEVELVASLGIEHTPTLLVYRDGVLLLNQPGAYNSEELDDIIAQAESLDIEEVRRAIAAEQATS